jgi:putative ABC transport system ATP-binding protein
MAGILITRNVNRDFLSGKDTVNALKNVTMEIQPGTLTIFRGRSGSGKTTLLNIIGALDYPTSGEVFFNEIDLSKSSEEVRDEIRRLNMGYVFQSVALISLMSAYENVEFGLRVAGYDAATRKARAEECLELVGLTKRMRHLPYELSGGEQQRVAIARSIAHKPKVIFADEPTGELDTNMGLQVVKIFKKLVLTEGVTVVMTTHDPSMVEIADHVFTLEDGVISDEQ